MAVMPPLTKPAFRALQHPCLANVMRCLVKTIGILGGMSAASTQTYYRELCDLTREKLGGLHSPELLIRSLEFAQIEALQVKGDWDAAGAILNAEAKALQQGGADFIILATNTMHKLVDQTMQGVDIPLLHIADATAEAITEAGLTSPGLMATAFTMEQRFYTDRLVAARLNSSNSKRPRPCGDPQDHLRRTVQRCDNAGKRRHLPAHRGSADRRGCRLSNLGLYRSWHAAQYKQCRRACV